MILHEAAWRRASRSTAEGDNCVEIAGISQVVAFRDSKDPDGPRIIISHGAFRHFVSALINLGALDRAWPNGSL
ncbi:DUF397 domain-containing protein [Actinomadura sp. WMMA1423]|uniref:DUF397 domain-containing protein n=1 Tax=Actinomadura sp. WMMA1423 TaxID=2591108 RepID=UPI0011466DCF|nr:DUF397 domain-containing protein [Actinomadura sp. WMMA1423]